jgi:hypothetical protein
MSEIIFKVESAPEGGFTAQALGYSIFTEADSWAQLRTMVKEAVQCHFEPGTGPTVIRLHQVHEELLVSI